MATDTDSPARFRVVRFGARPLLALPQASRTLQLSATRCYPAHTWKKRIVRHAITVAVRSGLASALWKSVDIPIPGLDRESLRAWIRDVRDQLGIPEAEPVFVWPADPDRGRIYGYWLRADGSAAAFCKLGLDSKNSALIQNEQRALEAITAIPDRSVRVPRVLAAGQLGGHRYVAVEMAPTSAHITRWDTDPAIDDRTAEYAGPVRHIAAAELQSLPWWRQYQESHWSRSPLGDATHSAATEGADVCLVHGDLNQTNILRDQDEVWLLDWERSSTHGPRLTDPICMEVDRLWPLTQNDPASALRQFQQKHWHHRAHEERAAVLLALAFLCSASFTPATALCDSWAPSFESHPLQK